MVNYLAVLVAAVAAYVVGALWYGPIFGKKWRELMHTDSMTGGGMSMSQAMAGGFVATLVMVYVLANLLSAFATVTVGSALMLALWIWIGFVAAIMTTGVFYERRSWTLYFINIFHYFFAIGVATLILAWWQ